MTIFNITETISFVNKESMENPTIFTENSVSSVDYILAPETEDFFDEDYGDYEATCLSRGDAIVYDITPSAKAYPGGQFAVSVGGKLVDLLTGRNASFKSIRKNPHQFVSSEFALQFSDKEPNVSVLPERPLHSIKRISEIVAPSKIEPSHVEVLQENTGIPLVNTMIKNLVYELRGLTYCSKRPVLSLFFGGTKNANWYHEQLRLDAFSIDPSDDFQRNMKMSVPVKKQDGLYVFDNVELNEDLKFFLDMIKEGEVVYLHSDICTQNRGTCTDEIFEKQKKIDMETTRDYFQQIVDMYPKLVFFVRFKMRFSRTEEQTVMLPKGQLFYPCGANENSHEMSLYAKMTKEAKREQYHSTTHELCVRYYRKIRCHYIVSKYNYGRNSFDDVAFKVACHDFCSKLKIPLENFFRLLHAHYCSGRGDKMHKSFFHTMSYYLGKERIWNNVDTSIFPIMLDSDSQHSEFVRCATRYVPQNAFVSETIEKLDHMDLKVVGYDKILIISSSETAVLYDKVNKNKVRLPKGKTVVFQTNSDFTHYEYSGVRDSSPTTVVNAFKLSYCRFLKTEEEQKLPVIAPTPSQKRNSRKKRNKK